MTTYTCNPIAEDEQHNGENDATFLEAERHGQDADTDDAVGQRHNMTRMREHDAIRFHLKNYMNYLAQFAIVQQVKTIKSNRTKPLVNWQLTTALTITYLLSRVTMELADSADTLVQAKTNNKGN